MQRRIVALDIGSKRIGIAVSDPFNQYALPDNAYICTKNLEQDIQNILKIIQDKLATVIVCGLPVNADGTPSVQTVRTQKFIQALQNATDIPVQTVDERYTSIEAKERLTETGGKKNRKSGRIDSVAACSILEEYLHRKVKNDDRK